MTDAADAIIGMHVHRGDPSPEELAAVIAVLGEAYSAEVEAAVVDDSTRPSAWSRTQRNLRQPLRRDIPWGTFAG